MERPVVTTETERPPVRPWITAIALAGLVLFIGVGLAKRSGRTDVFARPLEVAKNTYMHLRWEQVGWTRWTPTKRRSLYEELAAMAFEAGLDPEATLFVSSGGGTFAEPLSFQPLSWNVVQKALEVGSSLSVVQLRYRRPEDLFGVQAEITFTTARAELVPHRKGRYRTRRWWYESPATLRCVDRFAYPVVRWEHESLAKLRCVDLFSGWSCSWKGESPDLSGVVTSPREIALPSQAFLDKEAR